MANPKNYNDTTPAAPSGKVNVKWQADAPDPNPTVVRNVSAYMPVMTATDGGAVPTPPNDATKYLDGTGNFSSPAAGSGPSKSDVQQEALTYAADTGAANAYAVTLSPAPTIVAGSEVVFVAANTNTGASTVAVNGGSATPIKKNDGATALAAGDITAGQLVTLKFDGTNWQMIAPSAAGATTLASLTDVSFSSLADQDLLTWNSSTSKWNNITRANALPSFTGDVSNVAAATTVVAIQGNPVDPTALGAGQDGYVGTWDNGAGKIVFKSLTVVGNANAIQLRGVNIATSAASPLTGQVLRYDGSNWNSAFNMPNYWACFPNQSGTLAGMCVIGTVASAASGIGTLADVAATTTIQEGYSVTTAASATSSAGIQFQGSGSTNGRFVVLSQLDEIRFTLSLPSTANLRIWIGLVAGGTNATNSAAALRSDQPSYKIVGFRYHDGVDAKYQCVTQVGSAGGQQTINPETTSSHVDTGLHTFAIRFDGTNAVFFIDDIQVGSQSGNMPGVGDALEPLIMIDNIGLANAKAFNWYSTKCALKN